MSTRKPKSRKAKIISSSSSEEETLQEKEVRGKNVQGLKAVCGLIRILNDALELYQDSLLKPTSFITLMKTPIEKYSQLTRGRSTFNIHKSYYIELFEKYRDGFLGIVDSDEFMKTCDLQIFIGANDKELRIKDYRLPISTIYKKVIGVHNDVARHIGKNEKRNDDIMRTPEYLITEQIKYHLVNVIVNAIDVDNEYYETMDNILSELKDLAHLSEKQEAKDMSSGIAGLLGSLGGGGLFANLSDLAGDGIENLNADDLTGFLGKMIHPELAGGIGDIIKESQSGTGELDVSKFFDTLTPTIRKVAKETRDNAPPGTVIDNDLDEMFSDEKITKIKSGISSITDAMSGMVK